MNSWLMGLKLFTRIYLSEYCGSSGIYRVYPRTSQLLLLPLSSAWMLVQYFHITIIIWCHRMYIVCHLLVYGVWYMITSNDFIECLIITWHLSHKEILPWKLIKSYYNRNGRGQTMMWMYYYYVTVMFLLGERS